MNITLELQNLDELIVQHTSPPITTMLRNKLHPLREQMEAYIASKSASEERNAQLTEQNQELAAKYKKSDVDRHKVGVTLKNGKTVYYDANRYKLLPNESSPVTIEFRMHDKAKNCYRAVGHANWADVSEVHEPAAL